MTRILERVELETPAGRLERLGSLVSAAGDPVATITVAVGGISNRVELIAQIVGTLGADQSLKTVDDVTKLLAPERVTVGEPLIVARVLRNKETLDHDCCSEWTRTTTPPVNGSSR